MNFLAYNTKLAIRKYVQGNKVLYEIYQHRWCIIKDGQLVENDTWHKTAVQNGKWREFMMQVNAKFGNVYHISQKENNKND